MTTLYLHAPLAHVYHQATAARGGPAIVTDDNTEGHIRALGRYLHNNANNASQAALFSDLAAVRDASLSFLTARSHPSSLVCTKQMRVCRCCTSLTNDGDEAFRAIQRVVMEDPRLDLKTCGGEDVLNIMLPLYGRADINRERRVTSDGNALLGKKEALGRGLRSRQRVVSACHCGRLTGGKKSGLVGFLLERRSREAPAAASAADMAGADAVGTSLGASCPAGPDDLGACHASAAAAESANSDSSHCDTDRAVSATSDGGASTDGCSVGGPRGVLASSHQRQATRPAAIMAAMRSCVPPIWALNLALPDGTVAAVGGMGDAVEVNAPVLLGERDAELRKQVAIMCLFLQRAKSYSIIWWSLPAEVARDDVLEATRLVLDRLVAVRTQMILSSKR